MHSTKINKKTTINLVLLSLIILSILTISIGYAAISAIDLSIEGTLLANLPRKIFISSVEYEEDSGANRDNETVMYLDTVLNTTVSLSSTDSTSYICYRVKIYNNSGKDKVFNGISYDNQYYDNNDIIFEYTGINEKQVIPDKTEISFILKFKYDTSIITNNELNSVLNIDFKDYSRIKEEIIERELKKGPIVQYEEGDEFASVSTSADSGLKSIIDPATNELMYFYRGNVTNNYVYFAEHMWRILRLETDGSLRIILDDIIGTSPYTTSNTPSEYTISSAIDRISWENSLVYGELYNWYNRNIENKYSDYTLSNKFIFDTSNKKQPNSTVYYFSGYTRVATTSETNNNTPTFFSEDSTIIEKVALITGSEIMYAGGKWKANNQSFFLYNPSITTDCWTMTPSFWDSGSHHKVGMVVFNQLHGYMHDWPDSGNTLTANLGMRPIITIRGDLPMEGDGTYSKPIKYINNVENPNPPDKPDYSELAVGQYVNYIPNESEADSYTSYTDEAGNAVNQTFDIKDLSNIKWQILSIDDGEVTLISEVFGTSGVGRADYYLGGYIGYHAENELDNICRTLFSNSTYASTIRSININDINSITGFNPSNDSNYGQTTQYLFGTKFMYYLDANNSEPIQLTYGQSKVLENTYYTYNIDDYLSNSRAEYNILFGQNSTYWLNSKYTNCQESYAQWGKYGLSGNSIIDNTLFESSYLERNACNGVRAIVKLKQNVSFELDTVNGENIWNLNI